MISCPRCGFQQPQDKFCAKCGVDMQTYRPKTSVAKYLKGFTPLILVIVGVFLVAILFKRVEKEIQNDLQQTQNLEDSAESTSTQIGVRANSLADNSESAATTRRAAPTNATALADPASAVQLTADAEKKNNKALSDIIYNQIRVDYIVGEVSLNEIEGYDASKTNFIVDQITPVNSFYTEQLTLNRGANVLIDSSEEAQELFKLNLRVSIDAISAKETKFKLSLQRQIAILNAPQPTHSSAVSETVSMNRYLVVIDKLPRGLQNFSGSSILSSLMQSQLFLSQTSELAHILRFHDPIQEMTEAAP